MEETSTTETSNSNSKAMEQGLRETCQKVVSSLSTVIDQHLDGSTDFVAAKHGLDYLDTKNTLLISYLIDLTVHLRNKLLGHAINKANWARLMEMRTVLDKMRNLDKRLRYQIDKLLASEVLSNASSFAAAGGGGGGSAVNNNNNTQAEDPLQFRPSVDALAEENDNDDDSSSSSSSSSDSDDDDENEHDDDEKDDDDDNDLALARQTLSMAKSSRHDKAKRDSNNDNDGVYYRAPRIAAVPYTHDKEDRQEARAQRQRQRLRASELAQALRSQYGDDAPEQVDVHGGSELGRQRQAARNMAARQAEKTAFEEEQMVRLTTTRKEKKERRRLMRAEESNLAAISDLGNLVRDHAAFAGDDTGNGRGGGGDVDNDDDMPPGESGFLTSGRHASGKRKRQAIDSDGRALASKGRKRSIQSKNSLQAALFEGGGGGGKSKKKKSKKR